MAPKKTRPKYNKGNQSADRIPGSATFAWKKAFYGEQCTCEVPEKTIFPENKEKSSEKTKASVLRDNYY